MPLKNRFLLIGLLACLALLVAIWFTPFAVSHGVRWWISWRARQEGFTVNIDKIDAPFLRPVVIRQLRLRNAHDDTLRVDLTITDALFDLDFKHILLHRRGRAIRNLSIREMRGELRRTNPTVRAITRRGWATLHRMLPENLTITDSEVRIENGPTLVLLRNGFLSANQTEAGRFSAAEVMIASPWFHQTFSQLRGATHWEADHLTIAGLTLTHGLDLQSATADLSRLGNQRVGLQFDVDAFGGKLRANISHEWHSRYSHWKIAGGAADLSLAQISGALGFAGRVNGLLHAGNFTFRGNLAEPDRATASLWCDLTGLTWHDRTAEAIMLGAALYNRKIELQQLYIRQKSNQFTLSGEAALPGSSSEWLRPDFRGNIAASINQLGEFLGLFGANPADFDGKINIQGSMDTHGRNFGGHLTLEGASLTLFAHEIDSLNARVSLKPSELQIEQLDLTRKDDLLSGAGSSDLSLEHNYFGTLNARVDDVRDYFASLHGASGQKPAAIPVEVQATLDSSQWDTHGSIQLPKSSPINFAVNFAMPFGITSSAFQMSPINISLEFPAIFLASASWFSHSRIFEDGILSGNISLSETLQHPRIIGEVQLVNGKLSRSADVFINAKEAGGRISFDGTRASLEFLNVATKDVDLSLRGKIDFEDIYDVTLNLAGATPMFDLMSRPVDCIDKIEIVPAALPLAPAAMAMEFRGALFQSGWSVSLREELDSQPSIVSTPDTTTRRFPLCHGAGPEEQTLLLGAVPRAEAARQTTPKKREKRR